MDERIMHLRSQGVNGTVAQKIVKLEDEVATLNQAVDSLTTQLGWLQDKLVAICEGEYHLTLTREED